MNNAHPAPILMTALCRADPTPPLATHTACAVVRSIDTGGALLPHRYGCTAWTRDAIKVLKAVGPLVEIGAGRGHWQKALSDAGVDIVAYDNFSSVPPKPDAREAGNGEDMAAAMRDAMVGTVAQGDEQAVLRHQDRTLMLCYPPPGPFAANCLRLYAGKTVAYVGEGRRGCNADSGFFDNLEREWRVQSVTPLAPFPGGLEKLYVLRRR